jgi:N-acetylneuraminic acid mutarotase
MDEYPFAVDSEALATDGTFAYAFGGNSSTGGQHAEANRYDPFTNTWMAIASMTTGQDYYFHGEYGGNGKIYVIGGGFSQRATRIYDIGTNTWSAGTLVPVGIFGYGHAYANGKIYVIGGFVDGNYSNTMYAYDVASDTWSAPLAPLPQGEAQMACGVINNKIYVAGGSDANNVLNNLYVYDIATNSWTGGTPMPVRSDGPAGTVVNGKLWVIGGRDASGAALNNTQMYDPATNSWYDGPALFPARAFADAVTVNRDGWGQEPLIVGGYSVATGSLNSVEASFPACGEPSPTPSPTVTPTATPTSTPTATPTSSPTPTASPTPGGCVLGHGYWKNHQQWPVNQLQLGNRTYNRQELQSILGQPLGHNYLVFLARLEIAAKLNIANGADGSCVEQTLTAVDATIGNLVIPPVGNGSLRFTPYVRTLGLYNGGGLCAPHCDLPPQPLPSPRPTARPHPTRPPRP